MKDITVYARVHGSSVMNVVGRVEVAAEERPVAAGDHAAAAAQATITVDMTELFHKLLAQYDPNTALLRLPPEDLKMIRETLCLAQSGLTIAYQEVTTERLTGKTDGEQVRSYQRHLAHLARLQQLIDEIDRHRPLGPDGKHGNLHTRTCGCEPEDRRCGQQHFAIDGGAPCIAIGAHARHVTANGFWWE